MLAVIITFGVRSVFLYVGAKALYVLKNSTMRNIKSTVHYFETFLQLRRRFTEGAETSSFFTRITRSSSS